MNNPTIPLALVALELGLTAAELVQRFADAVVFDDIGFRCVPADAARSFIAAHRASLQAARDLEIARREESRHQPHPVRDRVRAVQASQRPFVGSDASALERVMADEHNGREQVYPVGGSLTYHPINERG